MKKRTVIMASILTSAISSASYVAQVQWKHSNYLIDGVSYENRSSSAPEIVLLPCQGAELTRPQLDLAIDNGDDVTRACVGTITDFSSLLNGHANFAQDIRNWDVSSGVDFSDMFNGNTAFNQDLRGWDISSGSDFSNMFRLTTMATTSDLSGMEFNGITTNMFSNASVDGNLSGIKLLGSDTKSTMFSFATITTTANLNGWEITGDGSTVMQGTFSFSNGIHGSVDNWKIKDMGSLADFFKYGRVEATGTVNGWQITNVNNLNSFGESLFSYGEMNNWILNDVTYLNKFFKGGSVWAAATLNNWVITGNTDTEMNEMFGSLKVQNEVNDWTINTFKSANYFINGLVVHPTGKMKNLNINSNGLSASGLQAGASLNFHSGSDVAGWTIQGFGDTTEFFVSATINSDIVDWDLSDFTIYDGMFKNATFDQDISGWDVSNATSSTDFRGGTSNLSPVNSPFG